MKNIMQISSMLLAAVISLSTQGITAVVETISGNEGTMVNSIQYDNKKDETKDNAAWSYVYFGSYPQNEVKDGAVIYAIDKAIEKCGTIADTGMDVWVNGVKYRRISKNDTNNIRYFDDMSNNGYRYFKWERIKWKVLKNDGNTLFVVTDRAIDCKDYNEEFKSITWETSTIREWLNTSFYNTAFSNNEQSAIVTQNVVNEEHPFYGTEGGNNTSDKIYLLSISEVTNETYGFCSDYGTVSMSRGIKASDYANARGTWSLRGNNSAYEGNCDWWLRSPYAMYVTSDGYINWDGALVNDDSVGICPALHINILY